MKHVVEFQSSVVEIPKFAEDFIQRTMLALKRHDVGTYEHCLRVSRNAWEVSKQMNHNILDQALCMFGGLLHDVGKIRVPEHIINKPGKLTREEYEIMKQHTEFGVDLVEPLTILPLFRKISEAILYHHERVDGKGYFGIHEDHIPMASKVILVVDTVDAMTEDRAYRKGCTMERAIDELIQCSGTQFDRGIVDVYIDILNKNQQRKVG